MFEHPKTSLEDFTDLLEIEAISTFLRDNPWEDFFDEDDMPPKWLLNWSKHWKVDFLWGLEMGNIVASGYLIHDESTDETFFSDLNDEGCSGFEKLSGPQNDLTLEMVWNHTGKYWDGIMGDTLVSGDFWHLNPKWLPRDRVEPFLADLLKKSGLERMQAGEGPTLAEWVEGKYGKSPGTTS